ncbi:2557_t:CDS:1, partial [Gigaspora rosea]
FESKVIGLHGKDELDPRVRETNKKMRLWKEACEVLLDTPIWQKYNCR